MASGTFFSSSHGGKELRLAKQAYLCIKTPHMMVVEAAAAVCSPHARRPLPGGSWTNLYHGVQR